MGWSENVINCQKVCVSLSVYIYISSYICNVQSLSFEYTFMKYECANICAHM